MKQILIEWQREIDSATITVGDITKPLLIIGRKIENQKEIEDLKNPINK